jgi:DNA-binding CsgD family transcriptional regulator
MGAGAARRLTDRQRAVMERIDRRVPIKVIAAELGVSETRINQHIRALKDAYDAASLGELVENYRTIIAPDPAETPTENSLSSAPDDALLKPFSEAAYTNSQVNEATDPVEFESRNDPGQLVLSDAMPLIQQAPWLTPVEPQVVPGVLDGEHAVLLRLGVIVGIATGILASVILTITAAMTLSAATEGKAYLSVETGAAAG